MLYVVVDVVNLGDNVVLSLMNFFDDVLLSDCVVLFKGCCVLILRKVRVGVVDIFVCVFVCDGEKCVWKCGCGSVLGCLSCVVDGGVGVKFMCLCFLLIVLGVFKFVLMSVVNLKEIYECVVFFCCLFFVKVECGEYEVCFIFRDDEVFERLFFS